MKRFLSGLSLLALVFSFGVPSVQAADVYASAVTNVSFDVLTPDNALGQPDGAYAEFLDDETHVTLDMGQEGLGGVVLTYIPRDQEAVVIVRFLSAEQKVLGYFDTSYLPLQQSEVTATYDGTEPFRYVKFESPNDDHWGLDAVTLLTVAPTDDDVDPVDEPVEEPIEEPEPVAQAGDLIKTMGSSSVYLVGSDGKRHAFPNEVVFTSWGYRFENVVTITADELASFSFGGNVTMKPGTHLVKITMNPKVYAVAPDAELRWVTSEEVAIELYGSDWASEVVDVADIFWKNYTVGEDINAASDLEGWEIPEHRY